EVCQSGVCTPGTPLDCSDGNPCTADACDAASGCTHTAVPNGIECAPATQCAEASTCQNGQCTPGAGRSCDDGNPCTADGCAAVGNCTPTPVPNGTSCSDGNLCNGVEACMNGACTPSSPVTCRASDQCHAAGVCDPQTGACSNPVVPDG